MDTQLVNPNSLHYRMLKFYSSELITDLYNGENVGMCPYIRSVVGHSLLTAFIMALVFMPVLLVICWIISGVSPLDVGPAFVAIAVLVELFFVIIVGAFFLFIFGIIFASDYTSEYIKGNKDTSMIAGSLIRFHDLVCPVLSLKKT